MAELDPRDIHELSDEMRNLTRIMQDFARSGINLGSGLSSVEKKMQDVTKAIVKGQKELEKEEAALKDVEKAIDLARKSAQDRERDMKSMGRAERKRIEGLVDQYGKGLVKERNILRQRYSERKKFIDQSIKKEAALANAAEKQANKVADAQKKATEAGIGGKPSYRRKRDVYGTLGYGMRQKQSLARRGAALGGVTADIKGTVGQALEKALGAKASFDPTQIIEGWFGARGSMRGARRQMREWRVATGRRAQALGQGAAAASAAGKRGKAAGLARAAQGMGVLSKGIGKLMKALGPIGLILQAASALAGLIKGIANLEEFLTDLNKKFLQMAGPTAGLRDIPGAMDEFNSAVFNLQRNLKLGIKARDIQELFGAMAGAGLTLQGVQQNVSDYGQAIYEARQLSLELGVSMSETGKMMADQMLNVRSSLDEVSEGFRRIAFDAARAGVSADKFWQAIQSSASELSYFGDFIKSTSSLLTSFLRGAELGFRDAEKATKDLVGAFAGIDYRKGLRLMAVMGDEALGLFKELAQGDRERLDKLQRRMENLQVELGVTTDEGQQQDLRKEIMNLNQQIRKEEVRLEELQRAIESNDPAELSVMIGRLAEKPVTVVASLMNKVGDFLPAQIEYLSKILGVNQATVVRLKENLRVNKEGFNAFLGAEEDLLKLMTQGDTQTADLLERIARERARGGTAADLYKTLQSSLVNVMGLSEERAGQFISNFDTMIDRGMVGPLGDLIQKIGAGEDIGEFKDQQKLMEKVINAMENGSDLTQDELQTNEKRLSDIVNKITSAKDYLDITKEAFKFIGADNIGGALKFISGQITKGLGFLDTIARSSEKELMKEKGTKQVMEDIKKQVPGLTQRRESLKGVQESLVEAVLVRAKRAGKDISREEAREIASYEGAGKDLLADVDMRDIRAEWYSASEQINEASKKLEEIGKAAEAKGLGVRFREAAAMERRPGDRVTAGSERAAPDILRAQLEKELGNRMYALRRMAGQEPGTSVSGTSLVNQLQRENRAASEDLQRKLGTPVQDYRTMRGGLALLNRDDMVFRPPAAGVRGHAGAFTPEVQKELIPAPVARGTGGQSIKYEVNLGGLTIQGDVADPAVARRAAENIGEMINQAIRQKNYDSQAVGG